MYELVCNKVWIIVALKRRENRDIPYKSRQNSSNSIFSL